MATSSAVAVDPVGNSIIRYRLRNAAHWRSPNDLLHEQVLDWAHETPARLALVAGDRRLNYADLAHCVEALACRLQQLGIDTGKRVGVCVGRNETVAISLLAIFRCGGVYVPLPLDGPQARLDFICADAELDLVLVDAEFERAHIEVSAPTQRVSTEALLAQPATRALPIALNPEDIAYIIYTSGSTGRPKGVITAHRQLTNQIHGWEDFTPSFDGLAGTLIAPFVFDNSLWEHFFVLAWGGTLHVIDDDVRKNPQALVDYFVTHGITSTNIPPVLLASVVAEYEARPATFKLRRLVAGAESVAQSTYQRFRDLSAGLELIVGYGPTEAAITATVHRFESASNSAQAVPIGRPLPGYTIYILDDDLRPVPLGSTGQIAIGGNVLAQGYLNLPELSRQKFVADPWLADELRWEGADIRMYLTGDLGYCDSEGAIVFQGRVDDQVKIRGQRVELGEIESVSMQYPGVKGAIARVAGAGNDAGLVVYLQGDANAIDLAQLPLWLAQRLPHHMLPKYIKRLDKFPLTGSGKVDKKALPEPEASCRLGALGRGDAMLQPPRNDVELFAWRAWSAALGIVDFGIDEEFLSLGGHSLLAIALVEQVQRQCNFDLDIAALLKCATVETFAAALSRMGYEDAPAISL